jgi:hypothetical protein
MRKPWKTHLAKERQKVTDERRAVVGGRTSGHRGIDPYGRA